VDVTVNSRLKNGVTLQAGVSTGKTMEDNCEIVAKLPEMNNFAAAVGTLPASWRAAEWCHRESPFLTQFKAYGVYVVPKIEVQVAGSFRSLPGRSAAGAAAEQRRAGGAHRDQRVPRAPTRRWAGRSRAERSQLVAAARAVHDVSRSPQRARPAVRQDHPLLRQRRW
jgi:hypothetical protein